MPVGWTAPIAELSTSVARLRGAIEHPSYAGRIDVVPVEAPGKPSRDEGI
jgi:hypothetical protein